MLLARFPCLFVTLNTFDELEAILPVPFESLFFLAPFSGKHPSFKCYSFVMLFSLCFVLSSSLLELGSLHWAVEHSPLWGDCPAGES